MRGGCMDVKEQQKRFRRWVFERAMRQYDGETLMFRRVLPKLVAAATSSDLVTPGEFETLLKEDGWGDGRVDAAIADVFGDLVKVEAAEGGECRVSVVEAAVALGEWMVGRGLSEHHVEMPTVRRFVPGDHGSDRAWKEVTLLDIGAVVRISVIRPVTAASGDEAT